MYRKETHRRIISDKYYSPYSDHHAFLAMEFNASKRGRPRVVREKGEGQCRSAVRNFATILGY